MSGRSPLIVHVGPDPRSRGGIAHAVEVFASLTSDAYDALVVPSVGAVRGPLSWLVFPVALARIAALSTRRRPMLVHLHVASRGSFYRKSTCAKLCHLLRIPYVAHIHGGGFSDFSLSGNRRRLDSVRRMLQGASAVCALSDVWATSLERLSGRPDVRVMPNPVEVPVSGSSGLGGCHVVFAGHLVHHKGIDVLSEALRQLGDAGARFRMTIAGEGPLKSLLTAGGFGGVDVRCVGWLDRAELDELFGSAAVFVLPSRIEGVPLALLEAMSHGLACVATRVGGVGDVIADGATGLLVEADDPDALAAALDRVLGDAALRRRVGAAAREHVRSVHSLDAVRARLFSLYDAIGFRSDRVVA